MSNRINYSLNIHQIIHIFVIKFYYFFNNKKIHYALINYQFDAGPKTYTTPPYVSQSSNGQLLSQGRKSHQRVQNSHLHFLSFLIIIFLKSGKWSKYCECFLFTLEGVRRSLLGIYSRSLFVLFVLFLNKKKKEKKNITFF